MELSGERKAQRAFGGDDAFESLVAGQSQEDARVMRIVFNDQQDGIAFLDLVAIVVDVLFACDRQVDREQLGRLECRAAGLDGSSRCRDRNSVTVGRE